MPRIVASLVLGLFLNGLAASAESSRPSSAWLFTSFRGNGDGLHLAWSTNGHQWTALRRVYLKPEVGGKLLRDPHILRGPDGVFHLVWTTGWNDTGIGYAASTNLLDWSGQKFLPLMTNAAGTKNCWAPETFYDREQKNFLITWSSDVAGRFPATVSSNRMNNRTYYVVTKDFQTWSEPQVFLDPGFDHIDTTILQANGQYVAVFKEGDMQARNQPGPIHWATSRSLLGPYQVSPTPIVTQRAEGPALMTLGDKTLLYVDFYADGHYGVYETSDWTTWKNVSTLASTVRGQRHGTIFAVPGALVSELIRRDDRP